MKTANKVIIITSIIIGLLAIIFSLTKNKIENPEKVKIIKYENGFTIEKEIEITSQPELKKIQNEIEKVNLVTEKESVQLDIIRNIEIQYNDSIIIGIQEEEKVYCWYQDKEKNISRLAYLSDELYDFVIKKLKEWGRSHEKRGSTK